MARYKTVRVGGKKGSSPASPRRAPSPSKSNKLSQTMEIHAEGLFEQPASSRTTARLILELPDREPATFVLDGSQVSLGRSPECDIQVDLTNVSRVHACIRSEDEDFVVEDMDSTNGTHVNGVRISRCVLRNNDVVAIGAGRIVFIYERKREVL
ncbi:MAG: FHA domain-containing protein [Lentisphaerae bacterium]|nr:FHA domain-containing protein [Lentisphaerota bacterium]